MPGTHYREVWFLESLALPALFQPTWIPNVTPIIFSILIAGVEAKRKKEKIGRVSL